MPRAEYISQIENLRDDLLRLGSMVEHALIDAIRSLHQWDMLAAAHIIQDDVQIDRAHRAAEAEVVKLIAAQTSVNSDPRLIVTTFAIAGELERIGDYACSIARRVERITRQPAMVVPPPALQEMASMAQHMLNVCLESFLRQDVEMAYNLRGLEDQVDDLEDRVRAELLQLAREEPQRMEAAIDMLDIVHALERVADRATNIGERVIYLTTSINEELNP